MKILFLTIRFIKEFYQLFVIILIILIVYFIVNYRENSFEKHIEFTKGKIFRIGPCARISKCVEYEYYVYGKKYENNESITNEKVKIDSCFEKEWTIAFDKTYPQYSKIIGFREGEVDTVKHLIKNW